MTSKKFVAWASSKKQAKEGLSLRDQTEKLDELAVRSTGEIVKMFTVAETASMAENRETFQELLAHVRKNRQRLDGILFVRVDRAVRNMKDWGTLTEIESETGVPLIFNDLGHANTPAARFSRNMQAVLATWQTDQQSESIRDGHRQRVVERGQPSNGKIYWLELIRRDGVSRAELHPIKAQRARRAFEPYADEPLTLDALRDRLFRDGVGVHRHAPEVALGGTTPPSLQPPCYRRGQVSREMTSRPVPRPRQPRVICPCSGQARGENLPPQPQPRVRGEADDLRPLRRRCHWRVGEEDDQKHGGTCASTSTTAARTRVKRRRHATRAAG